MRQLAYSRAFRGDGKESKALALWQFSPHLPPPTPPPAIILPQILRSQESGLLPQPQFLEIWSAYRDRDDLWPQNCCGPWAFVCSASFTGNQTAEKGREERLSLGVVSEHSHPDPSTQLSLPGASLVAQTVKNLPAVRKTRVQSLSQEDLWRRKWQPTPVFLPGESLGQRSLGGYNRGVAKSQTWLSN